MPNPAKIFIHNTVVLVTTRTEEGLPLVPTRVLNTIIDSVLGSAKRLFPVRLIAYSFQLNHFHLVIYIDDPENVSKFVGYVKQEIAHRLNRLLGRRKRTVWADGYDSPTILSHETAFEKIAYTVCNPVKDHVAKNLNESPFVSSWRALRDRRFTLKTKYIPRSEVPRLSEPDRPWRDDKALMKHINAIETKEFEFNIDPYSWKQAFPELANLADEEIHSMIMRAIKLELEAVEQDRKENSRSVNSTAESLRRLSMLRRYEPKKFGRRMLCLACSRVSRMAFIRLVKELIKKARKVRVAWLSGDFSSSYPPGLFPPGRSPMASLLPGAWW